MTTEDPFGKVPIGLHTATIAFRSVQMNSNSENSETKTLADKLLELVSKTLSLNDELRNVCDDIENELKFDFASIQLIRQEQNIIETVVGAEWGGLPRHYLAKDPYLRDIQADIAQTCRTEIIKGYDERFDRGVYEQFCHESMVRIFTPILLIKNEDGTPNDNWFDGCQFREVHTNNSQHQIIEVDLSPLNLEENKTLIEVVGTVEVGRKDPSSTIEPREAEELIKFVGKKMKETFKIDPHLSSSVLGNLAYIIKKELKADASSLFFNIKPIQDPYIHEIEGGGKLSKVT